MSDNALQVKAWMNPPDFTVGPDATLEEAFGLMARENIRHLLVLSQDGELVGVMTDRDIRRPKVDGEIATVEDMYRLGESLKVSDVMTEEPMTVTPDTNTADAARMMVENKFNCLPVVTEEGELVGIMTSSDLLSALVHEADPVMIEARAIEAS